MCSLCSRLRRGILYRVAKELGATKIALGHHRDDMLQTLFLNMFFGGKLKGMPAKLVSDNGEFMVIRPLAYVTEKDLIRWAEVKQFPIIPARCAAVRKTCSASRWATAARLGQTIPCRLENMLSALQNVVPSHLMDRKLFPFATLEVTGEADEDGDKAFDEEELPAMPRRRERHR